MTRIKLSHHQRRRVQDFLPGGGQPTRQRCCCCMVPDKQPYVSDLIPLLADRFHIVAPDLPGFGQSDMPSHDTFPYTFAKLAEVIGRLRRLRN